MMCLKWNCVIILFILSITIVFTSGFNLNWKDAYVFEDPLGQVGSYFGFTVVLRHQGSTHWLVVGAPRGNSTYLKHQYIHQPGIVYQCGLRNGGNCVQLIVDPSGNRKVEGSSLQHNKNDGWLGGAIAVQNSGDRMVICSPRWKNAYNSNYYLMNGLCYWTDNTTDVYASMETVMPLVDFRKQSENYHSHVYFYYAYGEAGFTAHFPQGSNEFLLGAPGVLDWRGTVIRMRDGEFSSGSPRRRRRQGDYYFAEVPNALKSSVIPMNSYMGYSLSSGRFFSSRSTHLYVSGAPRANGYKGKVYLFDFPDKYEDEDLKIIRDLDGTQMGEYFGGALCVVDLNGDHLDDLVVGAPQFSLQAANSAQLVGDEGRIYVYINGDLGRFTEVTRERMILGSRRHGARFGTALANVGDLNMDGYEDIAVGAPYEGNGVVYIYHGSVDGVKHEPAQIIRAEDIDQRIKGFGISLSKGVDVDGNHYNDIAVGAFKSGHAVVLKSHPVITFKPTLNTSTRSVSRKAFDFSCTACLSYTGWSVLDSVDAKVTMQVDLSFGRANFVSNEFGRTSTYTYNITLQRGKQLCKDLRVQNAQLTIRRTEPLLLAMIYELTNNPNNVQRRQPSVSGAVPDEFCMECPVLDSTQPTTITTMVALESGCKSLVCTPDLKIDAKFMGIKETFILGEQPTLDMKVEVKNIGEPAFLTRVNLVIPKVTPIVEIPSICHDLPSQDGKETSTLICEIGYPLEKNYTLDLLMSTKDIPVGTKNLTFKVNVTSAGNDGNPNDNQKELVLPIIIQADMTIAGISSPDQLVYITKGNTYVKDLTLNHTFQVWNLGPSPVDTAEIEFQIPHQYVLPPLQEIFMRVLEHQLQSFTGITCTPVMGFSYWNPSSEIPTVDPRLSDGERPEDGFYELNSRTPPSMSKRSISSTERRQENVIDSTSSVSTPDYTPSAGNFSVPPANRTLFLNCTDPKVDCFTVKCFGGPFLPNKTRAVINFQLRPDFGTLESQLKMKDIILFSSMGTVKIRDPSDALQPQGHKPDHANVHTRFLGVIPESSAATWIVVLAIICGILILFFIAMALYKIGFFKREKKDELQALKDAEVVTNEAEDLSGFQADVVSSDEL